MYFSAMYRLRWYRKAFPQLGGVKQRWDGKNKSSYTHGCRAYLALARLSCIIYTRCYCSTMQGPLSAVNVIRNIHGSASQERKWGVDDRMRGIIIAPSHWDCNYNTPSHCDWSLTVTILVEFLMIIDIILWGMGLTYVSPTGAGPWMRQETELF